MNMARAKEQNLAGKNKNLVLVRLSENIDDLTSNLYKGLG